MSNVKIFTDNIEEKALNQVNDLVEQSAFNNAKVRIMPDVHAGAGCVIGFTADLGNKVIPNVVGVDIGCGMLVVELGEKEIDLPLLDYFINNYIPSGFNVYEEPLTLFSGIEKLNIIKEIKDLDRIYCSLGTLGGGNHFIELATDGSNNYLVIHTGSRNLGKQVADIYQKKAITYHKSKDNKDIIRKLKNSGRENKIEEYLKSNKKEHIPNELCYLEEELREQYLNDMKICQSFATSNREHIAHRICEFLEIEPKSFFETIHNYISFEDNIVRKGAISAKKGEKVIIPMNMRDGSIIAMGKGNEDWNNSAPHGAGRIMSRTQAKKELNLGDFEKEMTEVYTTSVSELTLDEAPMVYKPMQEIIDNIKDTVDIVKIIKPIYNFKAKEQPKRW